jgi:hypothetical protein
VTESISDLDTGVGYRRRSATHRVQRICRIVRAGVAGEGENSIAQSWRSSPATKERFRRRGTLPVNEYLRLLSCVVRRAFRVTGWIVCLG